MIAQKKDVSLPNELNTFQVAAHSLITSSPVNYPINAAALDALIKCS